MKERLAEIKIAIMEDKKKAGVLAALLLLALIVGVRAAMKSSPKSAAASSPTPTAGPGPTLTPITPGTLDVTRLLAATRRYAELPDLPRDPFALDPQAFPPPPAPKSGSAPSEDQSAVVPSPDEGARRNLETLRRMRVRSIIVGPRPVAVIEWRADGAARSFTLAVGDSFQGFRVDAVTSREVTLSIENASYSLPFDPSGR